MGFVVHQAGWNGKRPKMGSHCLHQKFHIRSNNNTRPKEATKDTLVKGRVRNCGYCRLACYHTVTCWTLTMVSDGSVEAQVSLQSSLSSSPPPPPPGILCVVPVVAPPFTCSLIDFIRASFFHASPQHLGQVKVGRVLMVWLQWFHKHQNPCFTVFKPALVRVCFTSMYCIAQCAICTSMVPGFQESLWFQPLSCSMSGTICGSLKRQEVTLLLSCQTVCVCLCLIDTL